MQCGLRAIVHTKIVAISLAIHCSSDADVESVEVEVELRDVAHGKLNGTSVAVGQLKISPPAWPDSKQHTVSVSWVLDDGVSCQHISHGPHFRSHSAIWSQQCPHITWDLQLLDFRCGPCCQVELGFCKDSSIKARLQCCI